MNSLTADHLNRLTKQQPPMQLQEQITRLRSTIENSRALLKFIGEHYNFLAAVQPLRVEVEQLSLFFASRHSTQLAAEFGQHGWTRSTTALGGSQITKVVADDITLRFLTDQPVQEPQTVSLSVA